MSISQHRAGTSSLTMPSLHEENSWQQHLSGMTRHSPGRGIVSKRMRRHRFGQATAEMGETTRPLDRPFVHRLAGTLARKEPRGRPGDTPPRPQLFEQRWRQHDIAIPVALALRNMQDHPPAVDVANLKMQRFAETQTGGITGRQDHAVLLIRDATEKLD